MCSYEDLLPGTEVSGGIEGLSNSLLCEYFPEGLVTIQPATVEYKTWQSEAVRAKSNTVLFDVDCDALGNDNAGGGSEGNEGGGNQGGGGGVNEGGGSEGNESGSQDGSNAGGGSNASGGNGNPENGGGQGGGERSAGNGGTEIPPCPGSSIPSMDMGRMNRDLFPGPDSPGFGGMKGLPMIDQTAIPMRVMPKGLFIPDFQAQNDPTATAPVIPTDFSQWGTPSGHNGVPIHTTREGMADQPGSITNVMPMHSETQEPGFVRRLLDGLKFW